MIDMLSKTRLACRSQSLFVLTVQHACRRAVPLAVALLSISNPTVGVMDMLSRLSHDSDQEVAQNAILALGMSVCQRHAGGQHFALAH